MRRPLKIVAWIAAGALLLVLLLVLSVWIAGNTGAGRAMIEKVTKRLTAGHVGISGLAGSFPSQLRVDHLELRDEHGVWLSADQVSVRWSPLALLSNHVDVSDLHALRVDMQRLPSSSGPPRTQPVSIPRIDAAHVAVDLLTLGAQLAGRPASLTLSGNAHLRSVSDMIFDADAQRVDGDGSYQLKLRFDAQRMDAALNLHEPASGPLENMLGLPGLGALQAAVTLSGPRTAERLDLAVDAGAFRARAQGSVDLLQLSGDLQVALDSPALAPRPDLSWQRLSVHGRWQGSIKAPHASGRLEAEHLRLPGGVSIAQVDADLSADSGSATLHALAGGLRLPGPHPALLESSPVKVDATMRLDQASWPLDISASHRLFGMHAKATSVATGTQPRQATIELRLPILAELAVLAGQELRGSALLKASLRDDPQALRVDIDADAALVPGAQFWAGALGTRATLQASAAVTRSSIALDSMKLAGRALSLTGNGEFAVQAPQTLRLRWELQASDLKTVSAALDGELHAAGSVDGPLTALAAAVRLSATASVRGSPRGTMTADAALRGLPSAPSGTLTADGSLDGAPLHLDIAAERQAGGLRALVRRAQWKSAQVTGDITALANGQSHGQLTMQMAQLSDLDHLLGTHLAGSIAGDLALHPEQGRSVAQLHLDARDLAAGPYVGNLQLSGSGAIGDLGFKLEAQVPNLQGAAAALSADGALNLDTRSISLSHATATYRGQSAHLMAPSRIELGSGVRIDELKLGAEQAVLVLDGQITPALDLRASLRGVGPALVNAFVPRLLQSGAIDASAELQGSLAAPTGQAQFSGKALRMADDAAFGLPPVDVHASAKLNGDVAQVDAGLNAGSASRLNLSGRAPLAAGGALDLTLRGNLDVGLVNPLLEARGQHAAGELSVDAEVTGSVDAPQIGGTLTLAKGTVRDYARGLGLTDIAAVMTGSEGTLKIKSFTAAAAPGTVSMTGSVGVLQRGMPLDLQIKADNAQPIVSKLVTSNLDAQLQIKGSARERLDISGRIQLNRTLIGIPNGLPPNVAVLDVRRRGKAAPEAPEHELVIGLDVDVHAPREILVQGRGLDAEVGGDLHLGGTTDDLLVSGGFDLQRGTFSLASNKLNFTAGRVSFVGAGLKNKIDPALDFTAQTTVADTTAYLHITGLADAPQFGFTSNPSKQPDEIMALLLFGAPASQLTGLQLAQIGASLATLSGVGGNSGLNPLVKLQKSLGLDRLTVGAGTAAPGTENTGASIEAGRYISKRVFIVAKQSTTGTSQLEADVDLTKHLKLQTRLGNGTASVLGATPDNDPGSSVGLQYQIEY